MEAKGVGHEDLADGLADTGSPMSLVTKILSVEKDLPIPVPIEELAKQLDIEKIAPLETEGFEGGLVTDDARSTGFILVSRAAPSGRRRFTIGHELGHFLIVSHRPVEARQISLLAGRHGQVVN